MTERRLTFLLATGSMVLAAVSAYGMRANTSRLWPAFSVVSIALAIVAVIKSKEAKWLGWEGKLSIVALLISILLCLLSVLSLFVS